MRVHAEDHEKRHVASYSHRSLPCFVMEPWQWAFFAGNLWLVWAITYGAGIPYGSGWAVVHALGMAVAAFVAWQATTVTTGKHPLQYIRFLRQKPDVKPSVRTTKLLDEATVELDFFGVPAIAIACSPLGAMPDLTDHAPESVTQFLNSYDDEFFFVATTGLPRCRGHERRTHATRCMIVAPVQKTSAETQQKLKAAMKIAELSLEKMDTSLFEVTAGHGFWSCHMIAERFSQRLRLDWLVQISRALSDLDITTIVRVKRSGEAYEVGVDMSFLSRSNFYSDGIEHSLWLAGLREDVRLKKVRTHAVPFVAPFREQPSPYTQTVTKEAAVACCPFYLGSRKFLPS